MRLTIVRAQHAAGKRLGFTLVELLVVITIIFVLVALTASATMRVLAVQEQKNTETNIEKAYTLLDLHWKEVAGKAEREPSVVPASVLSMAGQNANRARVIWVKMNLKREFPETFSEARSNLIAELPPLPAYVSALQGITGVAAAEESAACLYMALNRARGSIATNSETVFNPSELKATNKPEIKIPRDMWGNALVFCRWPTGDPQLNPSPAPGPAGRDPQEPLGLLASDQSWVNSVGGTQFKTMCHPVAYQKSYQLIPVIMSAGPDKTLGVDPSTLAPTSNASLDNIYSYRLRMGGKAN